MVNDSTYPFFSTSENLDVAAAENYSIERHRHIYILIQVSDEDVKTHVVKSLSGQMVSGKCLIWC